MILFLSLLFSILSLKCRGIYLTIYMVKLFLKMVPRNWQNISTILGIFLMVFVVSQASLILHSCFLCLFFPVWVFLTYLGVVVCCLSLILKNSTSLFSLKHYLFIYLGLYWVFVALCGLSLVVWTGATLHCDLHASHCGGFSCYRAWAPVHLGFSSRGTWVSGGGSETPEHRLSKCSTWGGFQVAWDLPRPGVEPVSPALARGFFTPGPPVKL